MQFDIEDSLPLSSNNFLTTAIKYATRYAQIINERSKIILHSRKSLIFCINNV